MGRQREERGTTRIQTLFSLSIVPFQRLIEKQNKQPQCKKNSAHIHTYSHVNRHFYINANMHTKWDLQECRGRCNIRALSKTIWTHKCCRIAKIQRGNGKSAVSFETICSTASVFCISVYFFNLCSVNLQIFPFTVNSHMYTYIHAL